ncbi:hypothetical protein H5T53_07560 [Candidatus Bipolaricaulota bacterium]|nr:hypothetical protein [Candidatus Bipolaricaulota bacterium]
MKGHLPPSILPAREDQKEMPLAQPPNPKYLRRIAPGIGEGIPPRGKINELDAFFLKIGNEAEELGPILGLQGLAVIVERAYLQGKEGLG